jgi:DNA polymerase-3 subunit beta
MTDGVVAVSATVLSNVFASLRDSAIVSLCEVEQTLVVKTKHNTMRLKTLPYEDFPTIPAVTGETVELSAKKLIDGLRAVFYAASTSDIKPEIASVFLYPDGDNLVFVATDSFRLAEKKIPMKNAASIKACILPIKNCIEFIRLFEHETGDLTLTMSDNQLEIKSSGITVSSRVVNGSFPDYKQIIPKAANTEIVVLKQEMQQALKIATIFSDKFNQVTMMCNPAEKIFSIETKNNDVGEYQTKLDAALSGQMIEASFNYRYMVDCFQTIGEDSVSFSFAEAHKPLIVRGVGNQSFLYLIMPMNR